MNIAALIEHVGYEGVALAAAVDDAGLDARVPHLEWTVRHLVTHVGGVHRWAADVVRNEAPGGDRPSGLAVGTGPEDARLLEWMREGHLELLEALFGAPEDLRAFTFLPTDSPREFWARRQAHETAIHRVDAQAAAGAPITAVDAEFAQDGIDELTRGFGARRRNAVAGPGTLALVASDGHDWLLSFGADGTQVRNGSYGGGAEAEVHGSSSELYLWLWNRPSTVTVRGDDAIVRAWGETVRIAWE